MLDIKWKRRFLPTSDNGGSAKFSTTITSQCLRTYFALLCSYKHTHTHTPTYTCEYIIYEVNEISTASAYTLHIQINKQTNEQFKYTCKCRTVVSLSKKTGFSTVYTRLCGVLCITTTTAATTNTTTTHRTNNNNIPWNYTNENGLTRAIIKRYMFIKKEERENETRWEWKRQNKLVNTNI